jgi:hypothetical protein
MATNGQTGDHEVLAGIERAITGGGKPPARRDAAPNDDSITAFNEALAEQYRALGRHALEHGQYIHQACHEYADKLLSDHRKLATTVLTAERKLVADAENFIGAARG